MGSTILTVAIQLGLGQEVSDIATANVPRVIIHDYLAQTFGIAGGTLGRVSFIVFIIGLLVQQTSHRIVLWVCVGLQLVVNSMLIVIIFVQCPGHQSAIWRHSDKAKCWDLHVQAYYGYFQGGKRNRLSLLASPSYIDYPNVNSFQCGN